MKKYINSKLEKDKLFTFVKIVGVLIKRNNIVLIVKWFLIKNMKLMMEKNGFNVIMKNVVAGLVVIELINCL